MAMIPVELVLEKLSFLIAEKARLIKGVGEEIEILQDDLHSMKAFLQDAEARSETDEGVKAWVRQVRDVAYEAEDVLQEFMIRLPIYHGRGFVSSLRNRYHQIMNLRAQHRLAIQIEAIRRRVKAISERRNAFSFNGVSIVTSSNAAVDVLRMNSLCIDEGDVVGIENPRNQLVKWIVEGETSLTSISVVGMSGLGKTTLVKKVYDSIKKCFDCYCWITVSMSFSHIELLHATLKGFLESEKESVPEGSESMAGHELVNAVKERLQNKRYIIVFDDVWSQYAWEGIKYAFPNCKCSSRIIFTTRSSSVAASLEMNSYVYNLQPLPEKEAWTLFCNKAFKGEHKGICPEELKETARKILNKCEGLPLAIVTIGGLLSNKNKDSSEWKKVLKSLAAEMKIDKDLGNLGRILLLSYDDLPYNLKQCYLYLSVFPEDYLISRTRVIPLWVVERFVEEKQGKTMQDVADDYINDLASRSLIQVVEKNIFNRVKTLRIHDLMREIIQLKSREESVVLIANEESINTKEKVRRLSIHEDCEKLLSDMRFPYTRSLLVFHSIRSSIFYGYDNFFRNFKLLRVLELEGAPLSSFPSDVIELIHLRHLNLRRTMIREIPDSIRKLKNLEILDLKGTPISSLPAGIFQLKRLGHLCCYRYRFKSSLILADTFGVKIPSQIGKLQSLQKLSSIEVNNDCNLIKELGELSQLKKLGILNLKEQHSTDLCHTLNRMQQLTSLYVVSANKAEFLHLDNLSSPSETLQHLYLKCSLINLPEWIVSLQNLSKLVLQHSNLKIDPLKSIQRLPCLVSLELREAYEGEELCCDDATGYKKLKNLSIFNLKRMHSITVAEGAMPALKRMQITACQKLQTVPFGIEHLRNLEELLLWYMPFELSERIRQDDGEDFWKVQHIPEILWA